MKYCYQNMQKHNLAERPPHTSKITYVNSVIKFLNALLENNKTVTEFTEGRKPH